LHQLAEQSRDQTVRPHWQFKPGQSGNPRGRPSKAEQAAKAHAMLVRLAKPFGGLGKLGVLERVRLEQAVALLMRKPPNSEEHVRLVNAADRLIGSVERSRMGAKPQRRQSMKGHLTPGELPRSLANLVKPRKP
jgi:Family of unknown function (DUF5681)